MSFELEEEQRLMQRSVRELVASLPPEYWREKDRRGEFPRELWGKLAANGWFGVNIPEEYGGAGLGILDLSIVIQEVARAGAGIMGGNLFSVTSAMVPEALKMFGSSVLKEKYLPRLAKGEMVCSIAITEPDAGVNTFDISTLARKQGDQYKISGQKVWTTFAHVADLMLLVARTTPKEEAKRRSEGLSLFLIDVKASKMRMSRLEHMPMKALGSNAVFFDGVTVPKENLVGEQDQGWTALAAVLNTERIATASMCVGTGDLVLEKAVEYAKERVVFDRPIGQNQGIQFLLADSKAKLEAGKAMTHKACWLYDNNRPCAFEANAATYLSAQAAFEAADRAIQTLGGYGFSVDYDIERHWRDLRLFRTAPVPEQMVLSFIGQHVLGLPRSY